MFSQAPGLVLILKTFRSSLDFQLWMGEASLENQAISHTQPWGQKVGLKGRKKENKNKIQQSGFDPLCIKIPPTY